MTLEAFQMLLDTHGSAPEDWPDDVVDSAQSLLALSQDARWMHEEAVALGGLLDQAPTLSAPSVLLGQVMASAADACISDTSASHGLSQFITRKFWGILWADNRESVIWVGSLAVCAVFGIYLGASGLVPLATLFGGGQEVVVTSGDLFLDSILIGFQDSVE
ncbi:MAG: hypothetical protein V6Z81_03260 [Parvularculales bacterium]